MLISFIVFILILGVLIFVHEFGHFIMAKFVGVGVEKFALGFGPKLLSFKHKDTEYLINIIPLGGYVKLAGDNWDEYQGKPYEYLSQKVGRRASIILFGPIFNYIFSIFCFCLVFLMGCPMLSPTLSSKVGELIDGYPAQEAGILAGDEIIRVDNTEIKYWRELQEIIYKKTEGDKVNLIVRRDKKELKVSLVPRVEKIKNEGGDEEIIGLIGIKPKLKYSFFKSIKLGFRETLLITGITYKAIFRMITGRLAFKEAVTGLPGIFFITSKVVPLGFSPVLYIVALLGVSLAIFNLLPLPILDGGHILFLFIEKLRKKPLSRKTDELITRIGFSLIIALVVFVTFNDLVKFGWLDKLIKVFSRIKN